MADLLLIEHEAQLPLAVPDGARVIALSAEAMNALDAHHISFSTPDQYLPSDTLNALGMAAYQPTLDYCGRLDAWLESEWPEVGRAGIRPATLSNYDFKILADTVALRAAELRALIEHERPTRIYAFPTDADRIDSRLAFHRESAYVRVLPIVAAETGTSVEWARRATAPVPPFKQQRWLPRLVPSRWRHQLAQLAHLKRSGIGPFWRGASQSERDTILLLNVTNDIRLFMQEEEASWRFVLWPGEGLPMTLPSGAPHRFKRTTGSRPVLPLSVSFRSEGLDGLVPPPLEPLVRDRVIHFVRSVVPTMIEAAADADVVVDRYHPRVALGGIIATPRARAAAGRVRRLGVPLAIWQHGGPWGYLKHPVHYYNDLLHADLFLTYGEGTVRGLRKQFKDLPPQAELCAVGSPRLTALSRQPRDRQSSANRAAVVYAATCLMGQRFFAPHYRDCEYFRLLTDVATALDRATDIDAVMKIHQRGDNSYNPIARWCQRHAPRVRVIDGGRFEDWPDRVDLAIIDLPGTPLVEALARKVPILSYCNEDAFQISEAARPLLQAAVRLETNRQAFVAEITRGVALARELREQPSSSEFLDQYGIRPSPSQHATRSLRSAVAARAGALAS